MKILEILELVTNYIAPVGLAFVVVLLLYTQLTEALTAHRRAKREREQQVH